jgi:hypothetical protein
MILEAVGRLSLYCTFVLLQKGGSDGPASLSTNSRLGRWRLPVLLPTTSFSCCPFRRHPFRAIRIRSIACSPDCPTFTDAGTRSSASSCIQSQWHDRKIINALWLTAATREPASGVRTRSFTYVLTGTTRNARSTFNAFADEKP